MEILELKSMINEMKKFTNGLELAEETISKPEERSTEIIQPEEQKEKGIKKS